MNLDKRIGISVRDAVGVLRVLTEVCVSIDRIGGSSDVQSEEVANLDQHFDGGEVFRALSWARYVMTMLLEGALPEEIGAVEVLVDGAYWQDKPEPVAELSPCGFDPEGTDDT